MSFTERINPKKRKMHVAAISRIENEFHIGIVEDHRLSGSELSSLYDALDAVRYFIHHASREEAGLEFAPWHPERQKQKVPEHDSAWYAEKRSKAEDIIGRYRKAAEDLDNAEYNIDNIKYYHTDKDIMDMRNALKKAEKEFVPARREYQRCISFFTDNIRDVEFHYRLAEIRSDCVPAILAAYLGDCENVLSLAKEEEQEKKHARRMEKDAL